MLDCDKIYNMSNQEKHFHIPTLVEAPASPETGYALQGVVKSITDQQGREYTLHDLLLDNENLSGDQFSDQRMQDLMGNFAVARFEGPLGTSDFIKLITHGPAGKSLVNTGFELALKPGLITHEIRFSRTTENGELSAQLLLLDSGRARLEGLCRLSGLSYTDDVRALDAFSKTWGLDPVWRHYTASQSLGKPVQFEGLMDEAMAAHATAALQSSADLFR